MKSLFVALVVVACVGLSGCGYDCKKTSLPSSATVNEYHFWSVDIFESDGVVRVDFLHTEESPSLLHCSLYVDFSGLSIESRSYEKTCTTLVVCEKDWDNGRYLYARGRLLVPSEDHVRIWKEYLADEWKKIEPWKTPAAITLPSGRHIRTPESPDSPDKKEDKK